MVTYQLALTATRRVDENNPSTIPQTVPPATFWALFTDSWSFLSVTLPKIGVAILLIRIFRPRPLVRRAMLSMAIGLNIVCFVGFVICFVQCNPVAGQWDPFRHPDTHCWPRNVQIDYSIVGSCKSNRALRIIWVLKVTNSHFCVSRLCFRCLSRFCSLAPANASMEEV